MESFTLVLSAAIDKNIRIQWSCGDDSSLLDIPHSLGPHVLQLMKDVNYCLPILLPLFDDYVIEQSSGKGEAKVEFIGQDQDWNLSFKALDKSEASRYIRTLLYRSLCERDAFLAEVEEVKNRCY